MDFDPLALKDDSRLVSELEVECLSTIARGAKIGELGELHTSSVRGPLCRSRERVSPPRGRQSASGSSRSPASVGSMNPNRTQSLTCGISSSVCPSSLSRLHNAYRTAQPLGDRAESWTPGSYRRGINAAWVEAFHPPAWLTAFTDATSKAIERMAIVTASMRIARGGRSMSFAIARPLERNDAVSRIRNANGLRIDRHDTKQAVASQVRRSEMNFPPVGKHHIDRSDAGAITVGGKERRRIPYGRARARHQEHDTQRRAAYTPQEVPRPL